MTCLHWARTCHQRRRRVLDCASLSAHIFVLRLLRREPRPAGRRPLLLVARREARPVVHTVVVTAQPSFDRTGLSSQTASAVCSDLLRTHICSQAAKAGAEAGGAAQAAQTAEAAEALAAVDALAEAVLHSKLSAAREEHRRIKHATLRSQLAHRHDAAVGELTDAADAESGLACMLREGGGFNVQDRGAAAERADAEARRHRESAMRHEQLADEYHNAPLPMATAGPAPVVSPGVFAQQRRALLSVEAGAEA